MVVQLIDVSKGVPEEEIEKMLDEDLPDDFKGAPKPKEKAYITRQTIVLEGRYFLSLISIVHEHSNR